jgi:hypothetical protein
VKNQFCNCLMMNWFPPTFFEQVSAAIHPTFERLVDSTTRAPSKRGRCLGLLEFAFAVAVTFSSEHLLFLQSKVKDTSV